MSKTNHNYQKAVTNFLLSKLIEQFMAKKHDDFDERILVSVINGYVDFDDEIDSIARYKLLISLLLIRLSQYFEGGKNEQSQERLLYDIAQILYDSNSDCAISLDVLLQLRSIIYNKISFIARTKGFQEYSEFMDQVLLNYQTLPYIDPNVDSENEYTDEIFYEELANIVKEYIEKSVSSVLLEIVQNYDLLKNDDENELLNQFLSFKKRKIFKTEQEEINVEYADQLCIEASSKQNNNVSSSSISKKPRLTNSPIRDETDSATNHENEQQTSINSISLNSPSPSLSLINTNEASSVGKNNPNSLINASNHSSMPTSPLAPDDAEKTSRRSNIFKKSKQKKKQLLNEHKNNMLNSDFENDSIDDLDFNSSENDNTMKNPVIFIDKVPTNRNMSKKTPSIRNLARNNTKISRLLSHNCISDTSNDEEQSDKPKRIYTETNDAYQIEEVDLNKEDNNKATTSNYNKKRDKSIESTSKENKTETSGKEKSSLAAEWLNANCIDNHPADEDQYEFKREGRLAKRKWSDTETVYLVKGVMEFGTGQWTRILNRYSSHFCQRWSGVDLKDRYRNIKRNGHLEIFQKRAIILNENDNLKNNSNFLLE